MQNFPPPHGHATRALAGEAELATTPTSNAAAIAAPRFLNVIWCHFLARGGGSSEGADEIRFGCDRPLAASTAGDGLTRGSYVSASASKRARATITRKDGRGRGHRQCRTRAVRKARK